MYPVPPQRTQETESLWPVSANSIRFETASQIRIVESFEADAKRGCPGLWKW